NAKHCAFDEVELLHKIVDLTENYVYVFLFSSIFLLNFIFALFTFRNKFTVTLDTFFGSVAKFENQTRPL
ncbi:TPA: hypothetical protein ACNKJ7_002706, partial [Enterococcus faecium]